MRIRIAAGFLVLAAIFFALAVRYTVRHFASDDFTLYTSHWYGAIRQEGWSVFGRELSDYTPPYLYALYAVSKLFPNLSAVVATKAPQSFADFFCAGAAALLTATRWPQSSIAPAGAFIPTPADFGGGSAGRGVLITGSAGGAAGVARGGSGTPGG